MFKEPTIEMLRAGNEAALDIETLMNGDPYSVERITYTTMRALAPPIDMVIHCPKCGKQHIDKVDVNSDWKNPPHKSHLCAGCNIIFRPCDEATNGVAAVSTKGKGDTW